MPTTWTTTTDPIGDTGAFDSRMIFGDFDGDGDIDILYQNGNAAGTGIGYLRNDGGSFTNFTDATAAGSPFAGVDFSGRQLSPAFFFVYDFDGDGDADILDRTSNTTTFFRNNGGGSFSRITDPVPDTGSFDQRMVWGDFDGDGDLDALYQNGSSAGSGIGYLRNDGALAFTNFASAAAAGTPFTGVDFTALQVTSTSFVIDIDDDGDLDILDRGATQVMYRNDGGSFVRTADPLADIGSFDSRMVIGDFDGDGDTDVLYQNGNVAGTGFGYFRNDGGTFTNFTTLTGTPFASADFTGQQLTTWTAIDIDGDGDVDIVDRDQSGGGLVLFRQNGAPPTLVSSTPSDNGTGVAPSANITLTFSESVTKGNGNIYIYRGDGTLIETISVLSAQVTGVGTTWTIDPSVTLAGLTNYYIRMDQESFADAEGAVFAGIHNSTTLNFTTQAINTAPTFTNLNGDAASHTENVPVRLDVGGNATVADAESLNFDTGTLTVSITANEVAGQDVLSVANIGNGAGQIGVSGSNILYQGVQIATFTGGTGGADLVITFDTDATPAATQALVRALQYNNTSNAPNTATRTVTLVLTDGDGGTSTTQTVTVGVTAVNDAHTGGAALSGTATEDQVLTAVSTLVDPDGLGTLHYQWQRDTGGGFLNVGADQSTYTLGDADVGGVVRVVIYYTDAGGTVESAISAASPAIAGVNDTPTGGVSITGTSTENQVLTAVSTLVDPDGPGTLHYQWQRDTGSGFVNVGTDQSTYTLGDADVGGVVRVVTSYVDGQGFANSVTSAASPAIAGVNDPHTGGVSITGTSTEDQVLTADSSTLADADGLGTLHYQWQRDTGSGFVNVGTDQSTYTLGDADVGGVVRVVTSYTDGQGFANSVTSAASPAIAGVNDPHTGGASLTGTATENQVLTAVSTMTDPDGLGTLHYQWQRDTGSGFVNVGADQSTYTLGDADVGGIVRVVISYTDGQGFSESATSAATAAIANLDDPAVAVGDVNSTTETAVVTGTVFTNDSDIDGPALVVGAVNGSAGAVGVQITLASGALLTLNADGTYSYDPNGAFDYLSDSASGGSDIIANDSFTYTLVGGNTATVTISVAGEDSDGDIVRGNAFGNVLTGGDGDDTLIGGGGNDTLIGGGGNDTADYSDAAAGVNVNLTNGVTPDDGDGGSDTPNSMENATGSDFNDRLVGTSGVNVLLGGLGADVLIGLDGNDVLDGGAGAANTLYGGAGDDRYIVHVVGDSLIEQAGAGTDTVETTLLSYSLLADFENLTYSGAGDFTGVGTGLANVITGGTGRDSLFGLAGNDTLAGGSGAANLLYGGTGDDRYVIEVLGDSIIELAGEGVDTVETALSSYTLRQYVENLTYSGSGQFIGVGTDENNAITGNIGRDTLFGLSGDDVLSGGTGAANTLYGGTGDDRYIVSLAGDTIVELAGEGVDTVWTDLTSYTLIQHVENLVYTGVASFTGVGTQENNFIQGNVARDTLFGLGGNDTLHGGLGAANTLYGGDGDDLYIVEADGDTVVELAGQGLDTVRTSIGAHHLAANVENLEYSGSDDFIGYGNASNNLITSGVGDDNLAGGLGNDTLNGGDGQDIVILIGARSDYTFEDLGGGAYRVTDSVGGRDGVDELISIERISFLNGTGAPVLISTLAPTPAPLLVFGDDDFFIGKGDHLPLVQPGLIDEALEMSHLAPTALVDGVLVAVLEDLVVPGVGHPPLHDEWML